MKLHKSAESLVGIMIAVTILGVAMFGILSVINMNRDVIHNYEGNVDNIILEENAKKLIDRLDITNIQENETFYVKKDNSLNFFYALTGSENEEYKYINILGDNVNPNIYEGKYFTREFIKRGDMLRFDLPPASISNLVFHFDASNINGLYNGSFSSGSSISSWKNLKNNLDTSSISGGAIYLPEQKNNKGALQFLGNTKYVISNDADITGEIDCNIEPKYFEEKSFVIAFETGDDILSEQVIFKQGNDYVNFSIYIKDGNLYAEAKNESSVTKYWCDSSKQIPYSWLGGEGTKTINAGKISSKSMYFIEVVFDSSKGELYPNQNVFILYIDGKQIELRNNILPQVEHQGLAIGGDTDTNSKYFNGQIYELIGWNHALNETEIKGVENYLSSKWKLDNESSVYSSVEIIIGN